ncbi:MAG: mevalonate kinase family protein, partial [Longimicrobiales bacterium]
MTPTRSTGPSLARYPGRSCLLGEHCDWAGGSSLTVPLPMGITVRGLDGPEGNKITLDTVLDGAPKQSSWHPSGGVDPEGGPLRFVPAALVALHARGIHPPPTLLRVTSDLPAGRGFSSSAAFTLAVVDALAQRAGHTFDPLEVADIAYEVEHDLLGVACGRLDQIACASRAPVFVRWADGTHVVQPAKPGTDFHLVVIALPTPRDT